jgi:polar amino acid transport system substrate-binding protein
MKKRNFSETLMLRLKQIVFLYLCVIGISSTVFAETTLMIATGELPPITSEQPDNSLLTDVFQALGNEMGVKFVFQFLPWKRCELYVEELKVWGAIPYVRTPAREQKFNFSESIYKNATKLFGYSAEGMMKSIFYNRLGELKNYKIGGVRGYWYEKRFHDAGIKLEYVADEKQIVKMLRTQRIDLAPLGEASGWHMINTLFPKENKKFFTAMPPLLEKKIFLMTSKQYPGGHKLLNEFNMALRKIKENRVFQNILDKHRIVVTY